MVHHAERLAGGLQLAYAVLSEAVLAVGREVCQIGHHDLAFFPQSAGHERDLSAFGGIFRHSGPRATALIVGVSMYEQQTPVSHGFEVIHSPKNGSSRFPSGLAG
ncbi:hypothetical protein Skr01_45010 [Sphaerisporangium krabiense]|nr:hypothetical protein Skr01_45010 [Sphaerisporangium krabiense]